MGSLQREGFHGNVDTRAEGFMETFVGALFCNVFLDIKKVFKKNWLLSKKNLEGFLFVVRLCCYYRVF